MLTRHDLATTPALLLASALLITGTLQAVPLPNVASGTLLLHLDDTGIDATGGPGGTLQWTDNAGGVVFQLSGPLGTSPTQESVTVNEIARQAVRFPGGDSALTSTTNLQLFATNSDGLTAFVLFDVDSTAGQKFVFNQGVSAPFPGNNFEIGIDTGIGDGDGNFGLHKGHGNATIAPAGTILSDTFTLTTITVLPAGNSPANVTIHQDGTALSVANDNQGYLNAGSYATDLRPIDIGGRNDGATGNFCTPTYPGSDRAGKTGLKKQFPSNNPTVNPSMRPADERRCSSPTAFLICKSPPIRPKIWEPLG